MSNPSPPDLLDHFKSLGIVAGAVATTYGLISAIKKAYAKWREKHPTFRRTVLTALEELKQGQRELEDYNAAMLRERLESAYTVYVKEMGWCPSGQKRMVLQLFEIYEEKGWNHLSDCYKQEITDLPESKEKRKEYPR